MKIHTRTGLSAPYGGRPTRADVGWERRTEKGLYASYEPPAWDLTPTPARCSSSSWAVSPSAGVVSARGSRCGHPKATPPSLRYGHGLGALRARAPAAPDHDAGLQPREQRPRRSVCGAELRDAETVLAQLGGWIEDYNRQALHSALGMRAPADYRASLELAPPSV